MIKSKCDAIYKRPNGDRCGGGLCRRSFGVQDILKSGEDVRKYRMGREGAVPLDPLQLRFDRRRKGIPVAEHEGIPGVIRDACPSGYGAELINQKYDVGGDYSRNGTILPTQQLLELGADDAVGAIAACTQIDRKLSRQLLTFSALSAEIALLEESQSPSRAIRNLIPDATSAGCERPNITLEDKGALWLAKMQDRNDIPFLPSKEYVSMSLASQCDIRVPEIRLEKIEGTYVFMVRRFDRDGDPRKLFRKMFASARTALRLPPEAVKGYSIHYTSKLGVTESQTRARVD